MKKAYKIVLFAVLAVVLAAAVLAVWQWDNLMALRYGLTMDSGTLDQQMDRSRQELQEAMDGLGLQNYDFSPEEVAALVEGTADPGETAKKVLRSQEEDIPPRRRETVQTPPSEEAPREPAPPSAPAAPDLEEQIRLCVAEMYVLQATYEGKLDAIVQAAIEEYAAGELTLQRKEQVVYSRAGEILDLEKECSGKVQDVVTRLRDLLRQAGRDDSLAVQIENAYQEQKNLKKAQYLQQFRGR